MTDLEQLARRLDALERDQVAMKKALEEAEEARDGYRKLYLEMMERCRTLERGLVGQKAERLSADEQQLSLDVLAMMLEEREKSAIEALTTEVVREHRRRKPTGRKRISDDLPRVDIEVLPDEVKRAGVDAFEKIGQEETEVLERRPAALVVVRIIKPKLVRKDRNREATEVFVGPTPSLQGTFE